MTIRFNGGRVMFSSSFQVKYC